MDINCIGSIASIISLIISIITLIIVVFVEKKIKRLQFSSLFDKRISIHLKNIDRLQSELNSYIPNIELNEIMIKKNLVKLLTEFESIQLKLEDRNSRRMTRQLINQINKVKNKNFYTTNTIETTLWDRLLYEFKLYFSRKVSSRKVLKIYILVNENYNRIQLIKLDKNARIK